MSESNNLDPRMRNGWAEYQRLVLAELERHNTLIESLNGKLGDISLSIALMKQENNKFGRIEQRLDDTEKRLNTIDQGDIVENAINKYRSWLLGGGFLLLTAIVIPLIKLFFLGG